MCRKSVATSLHAKSIIFRYIINVFSKSLMTCSEISNRNIKPVFKLGRTKSLSVLVRSFSCIAIMVINSCILLVLMLLALHTESARILGVFTVASVSHQIIFQPIWRELSLRGHKVTVITPNPLRDPSLTNLTEIDISFQYKNLEDFKEIASKGMDHWSMMSQTQPIFENIMSKLFERDEVLNFIKDNSTSFDVVLVEAVDPTTYVLSAKFKCPLIGISSVGVMNPTHESVGNPTHPILHPDFFMPYDADEISFFEKVDSVLFNLYQRYVYHYKYIPAVNKVLKKYYGGHVSDVRDLEKNISLLFLNTNPVIHRPRPYGPNVIEFGGGIHLKPNKSLPLVKT